MEPNKSKNATAPCRVEFALAAEEAGGGGGPQGVARDEAFGAVLSGTLDLRASRVFWHQKKGPQ